MADVSDEMLPSTFEYSSDVSQQEAPPPLPARTYPAQVTKSEAKRSKNNPDNVIWHLSFTVSPDAYPADYTATSDPTTLLYARVVLNKDDARSRFQLKQLCDKLRVPVSRTLDVSLALGKMANIKVKHGSWEGLPRAEIDTIEAP